MKQVEMAVLIFAIILVGVFASLRPVTGAGEAASSPAACSAGDWLTRVIEDAAGVLTLSCATVSQEIASSCAANQFASSESAAGALTCFLVNWANSITAFPSACAANGFVSQIAATLTCTSSDLIQGSRTISSYAKTLLNSTSIGWDFRTGTNTILAKLLSQVCPSNQFVTTVADAIACTSSDLVQGARTISGYSKTLLNSTSIGFDFRTASNTILAKLLTQTCTTNQFLTTLADAISCTSSDLVQGARTISAYSKTLLNSTSIGWDFRTASNTILAKLITQNCPANQFVNSVADTIGCAAPSAGTSALVTFSSNANTCTDTTATTKLMAGFGLTYATRSGSGGKIHVTLNWKLQITPAGAVQSTQYQFAFGTGSAPSCNGPVVGTTVGNQYQWQVPATTGPPIVSLSETVVITGLSASTTYWFDLQMSDGSTASTVYSLPQVSVTEP